MATVLLNNYDYGFAEQSYRVDKSQAKRSRKILRRRVSSPRVGHRIHHVHVGIRNPQGDGRRQANSSISSLERRSPTSTATPTRPFERALDPEADHQAGTAEFVRAADRNPEGAAESRSAHHANGAC
jgi:hypothetical protein